MIQIAKMVITARGFQTRMLRPSIKIKESIMPIPTSLVFVIFGIIGLITYFSQKRKQRKFTCIFLFLGIMLIILGITPGILLSLQKDAELVANPKVDPIHTSGSKTGDSTTINDGQITLPEAVISIEECEKMGGEVFNTLGETEYEGVLIGRIEGLLCPCACRIEIYYPCKTFFDGCNTCQVQQDGATLCTEMYCEQPQEAKCLEFYQ